MELSEKTQFVAQSTNGALDAFFQIRPVTDVPHQGPAELYLQGLTPEALYTGYNDVLQAMLWLRRQGAQSWCDLGCGVGRTCLLWSWLFPEGRSHGVELVPERIEEARGSARALGLGNTLWSEGDFASPQFQLPASDAYFIYLSSGPALDALLEKLKRLPQSVWVVVIESHGELKPRLQWESWWLAPRTQRFPLQSHRHDPWLSLYQTRGLHPALELEQSWEARMGLLPADLAQHPSPLGYLLTKSYQRNWEVVIASDERPWTMDSLGLRWHDAETIQGEHPPRQFQWGLGKIGLRRLPDDPQYRRWALWRRDETPMDYLDQQGQKGERVRIRKLFVAPVLALEFSDGRQILASELKFLRPSEGAF